MTKGTEMTLAEATLTFNPDYSWVPEEMSMLICGVLGVCCLVIPVALSIGLIRWLFCRFTGAVWDNAIGDRILVAVLVGALAIGSLAQLAGWGLGVFGTTGAQVSASASAQDGTGDMVSNSWHATLGSQLEQGDVGAAMGTIGGHIDWDSIPGGHLAELGWNIGSGVMDTVDKITSGDWAGAADNILDGLAGVGNAIGSGIGWVGDKIDQGASWVGDKLGELGDWFLGLFK